LEEMLASNLQFVELGNGKPEYEAAFQDLARRYPKQVAIRIGYEEGLPHRIEAACDFFVMPSRFEPCGLNQMYSMRYGAIPVVRATGGLDDTVVDLTETSEKANGIKFTEYHSRALAKALRKALLLFNEPFLLKHYQKNAMQADFSWKKTTAQYVEVYQRILPAPAPVAQPQPPAVIVPPPTAPVNALLTIP
jgi:starch synthase